MNDTGRFYFEAATDVAAGASSGSVRCGQEEEAAARYGIKHGRPGEEGRSV